MTDTSRSGDLDHWECFCDTSYFDMWCVRKVGDYHFGHGFHLVNGETAQGLCFFLNEQADRIEALEAENERLREAVGEIKEAWDWWNVDTYDRCASVVDDAIRAALGEKQ